MASKSNFTQALKRLRSGRTALVQSQSPLIFTAANHDSGRDYEQKPEPWQGQGNKRKKPQRS